MAGGNASRTRGTAIALVAAALILSLPSIAAAAQCSRPERVDHRDAECLDASWKNRGIFKKSTFRVRNSCAAYGKVVAKVDLVAASDLTLHLTDGNRKRGHAWRQIGSISCCSDIGICNRSDAVTDEGVPGADHAGEHGAAELQVHNRHRPPVPARTTIAPSKPSATEISTPSLPRPGLPRLPFRSSLWAMCTIAKAGCGAGRATTIQSIRPE